MKPQPEVIDSIISIVGTAYFQPLADLTQRLRALRSPTDAHAVHVSPRENGYAASVCLLSVVALESLLARARHLKRGTARGGLTVFRELYPSFPNHDDVAEVFVLRDLLAHNHLWESDFTWDEDGPSKLLNARHSFGGDLKYEACLDGKARCTKRLRLHVVPNRVDRHDAAVVLKIVWNALDFMNKDDHTVCPVSQANVHDGRGLIPFAELVRRFWVDTNEPLAIA